MNKSDLISIRDYLPTDESFLYKTWLDGLKYGNTQNKLDKDVNQENEHWFKYSFEELEYSHFCAKYRKIIKHIISKPNTKVRIACLIDDPDTIIGYIITEPQILHWVYVRNDWRNIGIARDLIPDNITYVTHLTKPGIAIKRKRKWFFDPTLI